MPRPNNDSGNRGSSRPGKRSTSPREGSKGKSFKTGRDNRKAPSENRSSGKKDSSFGYTRSAGKTRSGETPFRKSDFTTKKTYGKSERSSEGNFSKTGPGSRKGSTGGRSSGKKDSTSGYAGASSRTRSGDKSFKKPGLTGKPTYGKSTRSSSTAGEGESFSQRSRFAKRPAKTSSFNKGEGHGQKRPDAFGKPFKKNYRPRSERPQTSSRRRPSDEPTAPKSDKIRLNKFIANSGVSSRREADELIKMGLISVNGKIITELGYKVNPGDEVRHESKVLRAERPVYILMNKPKGFLTTTDDPQERKTVMHIIGSAVKERIYPVGRLDRNTTGLLLLTNDGDLADKLMHPSFNVKKVYKVELDRALTKADFQQITEGVRLEEGRATVDDLAIVSEDGRTVGIELHIGWNRVVRRIFEALGYEVMKLDRTVYAGLDKKELARGQWRFLGKDEIIHLKHFK